MHKLKNIIDDDHIMLLDSMSMIQNLIKELKDTFDQAVVTLRLNVNTDEELIESLEKIFKEHNDGILKILRETADSLICK